MFGASDSSYSLTFSPPPRALLGSFLLVYFCVVCCLFLLLSFHIADVFLIMLQIKELGKVSSISSHRVVINLDAFVAAVADINYLIYPAIRAPFLHWFKVPTNVTLIVKASLRNILLLSIYWLKHAGMIFLKWLWCERRVGPSEANGSLVNILFELICFNLDYSIWVPKTWTELLVHLFRCSVEVL